MGTGEGFDARQQRWAQRLHDSTPEAWASTIVVCPSITFPAAELRKITGIEFYEERLLFLTLLLRDERLELIFPTSVPIDQAVVEYYLRWLPDPADARKRLHLLSVDDPAPTALVDKLLGRPDVVAAIRQRIREPDRALMLPFNVTPSEERLAETLDLPVYGPAPGLAALGSKSGARRLAIEAGVSVFPGDQDLYSLAQIRSATSAIAEARPALQAVVVKLNEGFSGQGNVIIEKDEVRTPLEASDAVFCAAEETWASFGPKVEREGAVVEELARAPGLMSPSVQLRILPGRRCEVVSTHDQILGGPDDQVYLGCRFPADRSYRERIQADALKVARLLAARGVIGSFGIDFVVVPDEGVYLSEINLRLGGTTHPFLMARYLTQGIYHPDRGELLVDGEARVYKASDNLKSERYVGLRPADVIAAVDDAGLAFDPVTATGATVHLLGALRSYGKLGTVCIACSQEEANALYDDVVAVVDAAAAR